MSVELSDEQWQRVHDRSLAIERDQGWDSLHTMATNYPTSPSGAVRCPFPKCGFTRFDPRAMFEHVHFKAHGLTFGMDLRAFADGAPVREVDS